MAYRGSEAYDFSLFEPQVIQQPKQQPRKANTAKKANSPQKKAAPKKKTSSAYVKQKPPVKKTNTTKKQPIHKPIVSLMDNYGVEIEREVQTVAIPAQIKKFLCFSMVCACLLVVLLVMNTRCDVLISEISQIENQIDIAEGENVRLNAELSSKISTDKIDKYAVDVLGMVKAENHQIFYIDLSEDDQIVLSGEKTTEDDASVTKKIKELFAYIF